MDPQASAREQCDHTEMTCFNQWNKVFFMIWLLWAVQLSKPLSQSSPRELLRGRYMWKLDRLNFNVWITNTGKSQLLVFDLVNCCGYAGDRASSYWLTPLCMCSMGRRTQYRWYRSTALPGEHNKECLLAERSDKHLSPLLILEDCQVSVAVSCHSSIPRAGGLWLLSFRGLWMHSSRVHPTRSPFVAVVVSGFPKHPLSARVPIRTRALRFAGGATCSQLVCPSALLPALSPFSLPLSAGYKFRKTVQELSWILLDFGTEPVWRSSMAQHLEINTHNLSRKGIKTMRRKGARFTGTCAHPPWYSQTLWRKPLRLTADAFEKVSQGGLPAFPGAHGVELLSCPSPRWYKWTRGLQTFARIWSTRLNWDFEVKRCSAHLLGVVGCVKLVYLFSVAFFAPAQCFEKPGWFYLFLVYFWGHSF